MLHVLSKVFNMVLNNTYFVFLLVTKNLLMETGNSLKTLLGGLLLATIFDTQLYIASIRTLTCIVLLRWFFVNLTS